MLILNSTNAEDRLKQKVLGKQEVFYGGQIFSGKSVAPPASKVQPVHHQENSMF